jgi:tetratricopeptide (TPR) repeat protein
VTGPNPFAQYHIGIDLLRMHRTHEALPHLEMVTGIAPGFYGGYFTLGKAQASDGKTEAAVASFTKAIDLKPDYADARYCRALVLVDEGDLRNAEADLRTALRLGLDREFSAAAHNVLGMIGEQKGELNGAIGEFEQAISLNPSLAFAHRNLAITLLREGREAEAIERLKQAIAATQGDPSLTQMFEELEKGRGRP